MAPACNVSVAVQPTGLVDPALMNLEDFTSQRLDQGQASDNTESVTHAAATYAVDGMYDMFSFR